MARTSGARSQDYDVKRAALASRVLSAVLAGGGEISLNDLARDSGASVPTLKHYFKTRSGALAAALRTVETDAQTHLRGVASPGRLGLRSSLRKVAHELATAWTDFGVGKIFATGLAVGLLDQQVGPGYLDGVLEPTLRAVEERLRVHAQRGEIDLTPTNEQEIRAASVSFTSPLIVALLHQHGLEGRRCRPLDMQDFIERHVARFVKAYGLSRSKRGANAPST
jgi:AcrR family transcriptional regulator